MSCSYKSAIVCLVLLLSSRLCPAQMSDSTQMVANVINDIYAAYVEQEGVGSEDYFDELVELATQPLNINQVTYDDLVRFRFLRGDQIDAILTYVDAHPMQSLNELQLIEGLKDYDVRNLSCFFRVEPVQKEEKIYAKEVFYDARHEVLGQVDLRNIEVFETDPVYVQAKYKFNWRNQIQFGFTLRRPTGAPAKELQYGGYIQINNIKCIKTLVVGNFQASFGQGLVVSTPFHNGKSTYVTQLENTQEGLKKYSSVDGQGMHGVGLTMHWGIANMSAWYSLTKINDSLRCHVVGANATIRHRRLQAGVTALEKIYSDTLRYYFANAAYNQNYFRGKEQFVGGANVRWNQGIVDLFGEVAVAQNKRWGVGTQAGMRVTPVSDVDLLLLYRYYSPTFDNTLGYAFSETSRINDENGLYVGADITKLNHWRFSAYGDIFRFSGPKYRIHTYPSLGYDAQLETRYQPSDVWQTDLRLRAKQKDRKATYALRYEFDWQQSGWRLRTRADANIVTDSLSNLTYGVSLVQDIQYSFSKVPLTLQLRLQGFDARVWDNRIYVYENDVLYAYSSNATYGLGGRGYLNLRWQIIPQLSLYFRVSETIYASSWMSEHNKKRTDTDIHLLLRATL